MKQLNRLALLLPLLLVGILLPAHATNRTATNVTATTVVMPVLRVTVAGELTTATDYLNGSMQLTDAAGGVVSMPAQFKVRGATARAYYMKPSLNMHLTTADYAAEADSALLGMRSCSSWILDAMAIDRICMRNRVAFDIWNEFALLPYATEFGGRNGTEGRFVELYINDTYYGIYCLSDKINRKLLNLKKAQEQLDGSILLRGALYKSGTQDIAIQNEPCYSPDSVACVVEWHNAWELKYPEEYAGAAIWAPLQDAILNGKSTDYVKKYFFLQNLADYQLHVMALCIADNWGNKNHFFSIRNINKNINDPDTAASNRRKIVLTPWDLDTSLGGSYDGSNYGGNYTEWPVEHIGKNTFYPYWYILDDPAYQMVLRTRWIVGRATAFSPDSINAKLERYRDLFLQSGAWQRMVTHFDAKSQRPQYVTDLATEITLIEQWYAQRYREMDDYFGTHSPLDLVPEQRPDDGYYYDLTGRRLTTELPPPGAYIRAGRVVLIP